ncbi:Methyltransferase small domain protein [compost metagenome]
MNEYVVFLRSFLQNPKRVGSVIPSSRFLVDQMVQPVPWDEVKAVAELGSGTGPITRAIKSRISASTRVLLFEMDKTSRDSLRVEFPEYSCYANASHLVKKMNEEHIDQLDCIISGLPFFNFESELRESLVEQIHTALRPGGLFIAFQYSLQMKKQLSERFTIENIRFTPFNFPPAFVYVCRKRENMYIK